MKIYYRITGYYGDNDPQDIEAEVSAPKLELQNLPIKSALTDLAKRGTLERYEVAVTAVARDA